MVLLLLVFTANVNACMDRKELEEFPVSEMEEHDYLVSIKITEIDYAVDPNETLYTPPLNFTGQILEVYKGSLRPGEMIQGYTGEEPARGVCPVFFEIGMSYAIFLDRVGDRFHVSRMSYRTSSRDHQYENHIEQLRALATP